MCQYTIAYRLVVLAKSCCIVAPMEKIVRRFYSSVPATVIQASCAPLLCD